MRSRRWSPLNPKVARRDSEQIKEEEFLKEEASRRRDQLAKTEIYPDPATRFRELYRPTVY
jgi:hypothetical protein